MDRSLLGDARDLLVHVVERATGVTLSSWNDDDPILGPGPIDRLAGLIGRLVGANRSETHASSFIHLGMTSFTEELLRLHWSSIAPEFRDAPGVQPDSGDPRAGFDADGAAVVALRSGNDEHILILGGSDYGTYFGVAGFLRRVLGARWIFPGPLGEVVPRAGALSVEFSLNDYDEPDFRGRSVDGLSAALGGLSRRESPASSLPEIDAVRTWALNNRLYPGNERVYIADAAIPVGDEHCTLPLSAGALDFKRREARVACDHALHRLLSPWDRPLEGAAALTADVFPEFYPDIRPRISFSDGPDPSVSFRVNFTGAEPLAPRLDPAMGVALKGSVLSIDAQPVSVLRRELPDLPSDVTCVPNRFVRYRSTYSDWGSATSWPLSNPGEFRLLDQILVSAAAVDRPFSPEESGALLGAGYLGEVGGQPDFRATSALSTTSRGVFSRLYFARGLFRLMPWALRTTAVGLNVPGSVGWKPCVYGLRSDLRAGRIPAANATLGAYLATKVSAQVLGLLERAWAWPNEATVAIAPNDSGGWCNCDTCAMSFTETNANSSGVNSAEGGHSVRMLAGQPLYRRPANPGGFRRGTAEHRVAWQDGVLSRWIHGVERPPGDPAARARFLDVAAARGWLVNPWCQDQRSRAVVDLTRMTTGLTDAPDHAEVYVTTFAYGEYRGAPMSEDLSGSLQSRGVLAGSPVYLGDQVLPYVTSTADVMEYDDAAAPIRFHETLPPRDLIYHFPRQFNEMRWSCLSLQYGLYEYMYGGLIYVAPRLYSRTLRTALSRAHARRARAFNAESRPVWSIEGPKWFELAEALWRVGSPTVPEDDYDLTDDPARAARLRWAQAVLGMVDPSLDIVAELAELYDELERRWLEAARFAEYRNRRALTDETSQPMLAGPGQQPWQLDAFDGTTTGYREFYGNLTTPCDITLRMGRLRARLSDRGTEADVLARIDFLDHGLSLVAALTRWSRPVRFLHRLMVASLDGTPLGATPPLPVPGDAEYGVFIESLRLLNQWVMNPRLFTMLVHEGVQQVLERAGVVLRGDRNAVTGLRLLDVRHPLGGEPVSLPRLAYDWEQITDYVGAWNAAVRREAIVSDKPLWAMIQSIKEWVVQIGAHLYRRQRGLPDEVEVISRALRSLGDDTVRNPDDRPANQWRRAV